MVLRVDRRPAKELQPARRRGIAQESERQLAILAGILRARDHHPAVIARQDLSLAVEVGRIRQEGPERGPPEWPARLLTDRIVEEGQAFSVGYEKQIASAIFEADPAWPLHLQGSRSDM